MEESQQGEFERMRKLKGRLSKVVAGWMAAMLILGSGADTVFAAEAFNSRTEAVYVSDESTEKLGQDENSDPEDNSDVVTEEPETEEPTTEEPATEEPTTEETTTEEPATEEPTTEEVTTEEPTTEEPTTEEVTTEEPTTEEKTTEQKTADKKTTEKKTTIETKKKTDEDAQKKLEEEKKLEEQKILEEQKKKLEEEKAKTSEIEKKGDEEDSAVIKSVPVNESTFPDPNFRAYVLEDFDTDGNHILDEKEIIYARNIQADKRGIKSVKGIEYLTELRGIYISFNQISDWDLSKNKQLIGIWCSNNLFTSLDFSNLPNLEWVYCFECKLTSLNVSNNKKMSYIECNTNPNLKKLDVSNNLKLEHLMCGSCGLTELDVSNNTNLQHLDAFRNKFKTLDLSNNLKMKRLDIWDNPNLGPVDISMLKELQYYNCANNKLKKLDVSHNPELTKLNCAYNRSLSSLDLSHNPKLVYLDCACCNLKKLDISNNQKLYFLQAFTNPFTSLDIGYNPLLIKTYHDGVKKAESICKGHSWTIDYGGDTSTGGDNIYFLCVDDICKIKDSAKYEIEDRADASINPGSLYMNLITREQAITTLYNMAGKPSVSGTSRFKDVKKGSYYEKAVIWGEKNALCMGFPDVSSDNFGVGKYIERQDLMFMLMRYAECMGLKREIDFGRSDEFVDYFDVDYYCWEAVCWAATWRIMIGKGKVGAPKSERYIEPHVAATNEDFTTMYSRMMEANSRTGKLKIATREDYTPGFTGIAQSATNNQWYFYNDGKYDRSYSGIAQATNGRWYYVKNGKIDRTFTDKIAQATNGNWYYVKDGKPSTKFTGKIAYATNGNWYYCTDGKPDLKATAFIAQATNGEWYFVNKGKIDKTYTGITHATNGQFYYCKNGKLDRTYTGTYYQNGQYFNVRNGKVIF